MINILDKVENNSLISEISYKDGSTINDVISVELVSCFINEEFYNHWL